MTAIDQQGRARHAAGAPASKGGQYAPGAAPAASGALPGPDAEPRAYRLRSGVVVLDGAANLDEANANQRLRRAGENHTERARLAPTVARFDTDAARDELEAREHRAPTAVLVAQHGVPHVVSGYWEPDLTEDGSGGLILPDHDVFPFGPDARPLLVADGNSDGQRGLVDAWKAAATRT